MLHELPLPSGDRHTPALLTAFIELAEEHIDAYQESVGEQLSPRFEPADYREVAEVLVPLRRDFRNDQIRFCEWGCGFGVVAGMAAQLGFQASGIELDPVLWKLAVQLHRKNQLPTHLIHGDFIHPAPDVSAAYTPDQVDLFYAFPWPDEVESIKDHFARVAAPSARLLLYLEFGDMRHYIKEPLSGPGPLSSPGGTHFDSGEPGPETDNRANPCFPLHGLPP